MTEDTEKKLSEAFMEARKLCHPYHVGLTSEDAAEIKAYHAGLNNLGQLLVEKGLVKDNNQWHA